MAAQAALSEANEKNYEFMRSLGSAEQAKQTLHGQVLRYFFLLLRPYSDITFFRINTKSKHQIHVLEEKAEQTLRDRCYPLTLNPKP